MRSIADSIFGNGVDGVASGADADACADGDGRAGCGQPGAGDDLEGDHDPSQPDGGS